MSKKLDQLVVNYTRWIIRRRWPILILAVLATLFLASGARFLYFDASYRVFFSKDNPQLNAFEALQDIYTKNDNILFVVESKNGNIFTPQNLAAIEELTAEAWKVPYAIRVDAITNFQHTRAFDDDLVVADLIEDAGTLSKEDIEEAKHIALREPFLRDRLITEKTNVTGVNVTVHLPGEDKTKEVPEAVTYARELVRTFEESNPDLKVYLTGVTMLNNAFSEAGLNDMRTLVPAMYVIMFLIMFVILRSISGTVSSIIIIALSMVTAMGIAGWFKVGLTAVSAQATTMIMTLAIADSVHILVTMFKEMAKGANKRDAIVESMRLNFQPVLLTSLTTAIGFLSMNFSDAPPFRHLGNITATGVMLAYVYSILLLPALVSILPFRKKAGKETQSVFFDKLSDFVIQRRKTLLWGSAVVALAMASFLPQNILNDQFVKYFDESIQFRRDTDFSMKNLSGIYQVEFSLNSGESGGIANPEYLTKVDEFAQWYRQQPGVTHVSYFSEVMKRVNKSMHNDEETWYRVPENRELAAQYLLLYEMSLPYGLDLNNQINVDKSATRFTVTLADLSSRELRDVAGRGENWLRENAPDYMFTHGVGPAIMFANISGRNVKSMINGTTIALILISLSLILALRSVKFGLLSLIPNLVPAAIAFGVWGLTAGEINLAISMVMGMTLGIVVDDTVHFMSKYLRARRENDLDPQAAVRYAFTSVGKALVVTTVILVSGFSILSFSAFEMNAGMGKLSALTIAIALIVDLLFLPVILMKAEEKEFSRDESFEREVAAEGVLSA